MPRYPYSEYFESTINRFGHYRGHTGDGVFLIRMNATVTPGLLLDLHCLVEQLIENITWHPEIENILPSSPEISSSRRLRRRATMDNDVNFKLTSCHSQVIIYRMSHLELLLLSSTISVPNISSLQSPVAGSTIAS